MKFQRPKSESFYSMIAFVIMVLLLLSYPCSAQEKEEEETYSISLVQTAEVDREIHEIEGKKVLAESYTVKKGDHIWGVLRNRGLIEKGNFAAILSALGKLNSSLTNLDLIHPGEKIIIPLIIAPAGGTTALAQKSPPVTVPIEAIKDLNVEQYTIKPGDGLIKVVKSLYEIPQKELYDEYLDLLRKTNPSIRDLNTIYAGQKVRIPIYSPKVVRAVIKPPPPSPEPASDTEKEDLKKLGHELGEVFTLIGEEWVHTGKHFIPLKTGGQINLNADSYPIIDLRNGNRLIMDLYNDLPEKMANLISSNWDIYRIIHFGRATGLKNAIDVILPKCDYDRIYGADEPLVLSGDIPLRITADWIIKLDPKLPAEQGNIIIVNLPKDMGSRIPAAIRTYLRGFGIKVVEYPPILETTGEAIEEVETLETGDDASSLIEILLNLTGRNFSSKMEIPIYQSKKTDFNLIVKADFFLNINGRDCIIDLSGLGPDIITLLKEHQFLVLAISGEKSSAAIVTKTLEFLGVEFDSKPHPFLATDRADSNNIRLMIPGIIFQDNNAQNIFATHLRLPPEIIGFLTRKGYKILRLPIFESL
ncbi:hypothetical protein ACFL0H_11450 [Thermodesulfobacteriota bacterium]